MRPDSNWYGSCVHKLACGRFTTAMTIIRTMSVSLSLIQTGAWKQKKIDPDSFENHPLVYLAPLKNTTRQTISLHESFLKIGKSCRFDLLGLKILDGNCVKWDLFIVTNTMNTYNSLMSVNLKYLFGMKYALYAGL